jgi:hypothetical protein
MATPTCDDECLAKLTIVEALLGLKVYTTFCFCCRGLFRIWALSEAVSAFARTYLVHKDLNELILIAITTFLKALIH